MDAERFDSLSRSLIRTGSRRALSRVLAALALGGVLGSETMVDVAARNKNNKNNKNKK